MRLTGGQSRVVGIIALLNAFSVFFHTLFHLDSVLSIRVQCLTCARFQCFPARCASSEQVTPLPLLAPKLVRLLCEFCFDYCIDLVRRMYTPQSLEQYTAGCHWATRVSDHLRCYLPVPQQRRSKPALTSILGCRIWG